MTFEPVRGRRRGARWRRVTRGIHLPSSLPRTVGNELAAWQLVLPPSGAFTHLTAAAAYGWWLPPLPSGLPVFAAQSIDDARPRRKGLQVSRHTDVPVVERGGLRLTDPASTLLACARHLALLDLVVLIDAALHSGDVTLDQLDATAAPRRAGAPMLRRALALADGRSESPWETLLRQLHRSAGIEVEPQREVFDAAGQFLARGDLWLVGTRVLHEYDGAGHLDRRRQRDDLRRARSLANTGWIRRGYTSREVLHQPVTVLRDADLSLGRPHRPGRVQRWYALLGKSLFTPAGRTRLELRLGIRRGAGAAIGRQRQA